MANTTIQADVITYEDFVLADEKPGDVSQEDWEQWETILYAAKLPAWARKPKTLVAGGVHLALVEGEVQG